MDKRDKLKKIYVKQLNEFNVRGAFCSHIITLCMNSILSNKFISLDEFRKVFEDLSRNQCLKMLFAAELNYEDCPHEIFKRVTLPVDWHGEGFLAAWLVCVTTLYRYDKYAVIHADEIPNLQRIMIGEKNHYSDDEFLKGLVNSIWSDSFDRCYDIATCSDTLPKLSMSTLNVYKCTKDFILDNGYSPTVREIAELLSIHSTATVTYHLHKLQDANLITMREGVPRTIVLKGYRVCKVNL